MVEHSDGLARALQYRRSVSLGFALPPSRRTLRLARATIRRRSRRRAPTIVIGARAEFLPYTLSLSPSLSHPSRARGSCVRRGRRSSFVVGRGGGSASVVNSPRERDTADTCDTSLRARRAYVPPPLSLSPSLALARARARARLVLARRTASDESENAAALGRLADGVNHRQPPGFSRDPQQLDALPFPPSRARVRSRSSSDLIRSSVPRLSLPPSLPPVPSSPPTLLPPREQPLCPARAPPILSASVDSAEGR